MSAVAGHIWLLCVGGYSDRIILGAYTDESMVRAMAVHIGGYVEVVPINAEVSQWRRGERPYHVVMDADGSNVTVKGTPWDDADGHSPEWQYSMCYERYLRSDPKYCTACFTCVWAHSPTEAIQLAHERRQQGIRPWPRRSALGEAES